MILTHTHNSELNKNEYISIGSDPILEEYDTDLDPFCEIPDSHLECIRISDSLGGDMKLYDVVGESVTFRISKSIKDICKRKFVHRDIIGETTESPEDLLTEELKLKCAKDKETIISDLIELIISHLKSDYILNYYPLDEEQLDWVRANAQYDDDYEGFIPAKYRGTDGCIHIEMRRNELTDEQFDEFSKMSCNRISWTEDEPGILRFHLAE